MSKLTPVLFICIVCLSLITSCKHSTKINNDSVKVFLTNFNTALQTGKTNAIIAQYFNGDNFKIRRLTNLLEGNCGVNTNATPLFKLSLDVNSSTITNITPGIADVSIPIIFSSTDAIGIGRTALTLKISTTDSKNLRIVQIEGSKFLLDYIAYENLVKSKTLTDEDIYAPITLKAFETAKQLKTKYDSVIWFEHINKQTYFFVTKGKWNFDEVNVGGPHPDTIKTYKMGLVNPSLKEIIPVEYDLIHNIDGTIKGLVEVEKEHKHGFYNLDGKIVVPVEYDQIFPVNNELAIAALRKGDDFYWLNKDLTISDKIIITLGEVLAQTTHLGTSNQDGDDINNVTEFNSREMHGTIYIPPSYLVYMGIFGEVELFKNPLRKNVEFEDVSSKYDITLGKKITIENGDNVFESTLYSIRNYYLGGRSEFYDSKKIMVVDKKREQIYSNVINNDYTETDGSTAINCNEYEIKALNDSLFEVKLSAAVEIPLPNSSQKEFLLNAPVYHYLFLRNGKLVEKETSRIFSFTKFIKMDDSYLQGCYSYENEQTDYLKHEFLKYVKNEIFADYNYKFKDSTWTEEFNETMFNTYQAKNISVDDSLTEIDKYNINWINQKLKSTASKKMASR